MKKILIINNAEPGISDFNEPFVNIVKDSEAMPVVADYRNCANFNFSCIDGIILSGSPRGDDIVEHHQPYFQWLKSFAKPVFGVCAGHHVTGALYGSELFYSQEPESGDFYITILRNDPIFNGLPDTLKVKQMHNDSIALPDNFDLLATSKTCVNQMMKHKEKPLYTCQFHPEFYNHELISNFIKLT